MIDSLWQQSAKGKVEKVVIESVPNHIAAVALGWATARNQIPLDRVQVLHNTSEIEKYFFDGYGFGQTLNFYGTSIDFKSNLITICPESNIKRYCQYGVGRATYFLGIDKSLRKENIDMVAGYEFAAIFAGDLQPTQPTFAERLAQECRAATVPTVGSPPPSPHASPERKFICSTILRRKFKIDFAVTHGHHDH